MNETPLHQGSEPLQFAHPELFEQARAAVTITVAEIEEVRRIYDGQ